MKIGRRGVARWVFGFAVSLIVIPSVWAEGIVIVSRTSDPRANTDLTPLLDTLEMYGFAVSPSQLRQAIGPRFPMEAQSPDASIASLAEVLEQANTMWLAQPPLQQLLPVLEHVAEMARRNPALLIRRPSLRSRYHQLLIWLALAYQRAGDLARSEEAMSELIRTAPTRIVTRAQDGPAAEQLYALTKANMSKRHRGSLEVRIDAPNVQAYLDEQIVRANMPIPNLTPGPHRLVLIDSLDRARLHEVVVASDQTTVVEITWSLDTAVSAGDRFVELTFQTETDYARRAELAHLLARSADARRFVVIDVVFPRNDLLRVTASLREARSNRTIREASATVWGERAMRALGQFIQDGTPSHWIIIHASGHVSGQQQAVPALSAPRAAPKPAPRRIRKYIATAAAGTALAAGATLLYLSPLRLCDPQDRDPAGRCPTYFSLEPHGFISLGLGTALGGLAGYWWYSDRAPRPRVGVQLDPVHRGGSIVATWLLP